MLIWLAFLAVIGTPTWNDLRFGMAENEVKQVLQNRAESPLDNEKSLNPEFYVAWVVHSLKMEDFEGRALLAFNSKTHGLCSIRIDFRPPADAASVVARQEKLRQALSKQYGKPVSDHICADGACVTTWESKGQKVQLHVFPGAPVTMLSYDPMG